MYDVKIEDEVQQYWKEHDVYHKVKEKNKDGELWYFCEGPPYATGDPHPGTLWNHIMKDVVLRYKRFRGYNVHDRAGYDTHGLPIEVKVEKELGFKGKKDIEEYGLDKFILKCKEFATRYVQSMSQQIGSFGVWLDYDNPYLTYKESYMNKVWKLIKTAHEKGLLYEGDYVVPYCPRCQTTLANYELEYFDREDPSIFVKFKVKDTDNEYLIIWTTTPWTLISNMAVMAHPTFTYVKVKVDDEVWILAKERVDHLFSLIDKPVVILEEMTGKRLEGLRYEHPLQEFIGKEYDRRVVLSDEFVTLEEGSGLVHTAPGHGPEDYTVGKRYGIEVYSPVDREGKFDDTTGKYKGLEVLKANPIVIDDLKRVGALVHAGTIQHRYPRCWRCKTPLIYINMTQWFLKISALKDDMLNAIREDVYWIPPFLKNRMLDFVGEAPDWCITRQRYWGIPLPVWRCESCGKIKVIGDVSELPQKPTDLHRPWIDEIELTCEECGGKMKRVPDVLDVWIDSGNAVWASLTDEEMASGRYGPAEFIIEGRDQIRGWFYSLLGSGMIYWGYPPYKTVMMHGMFLDKDGNKMSKSLGNYIPIDEIKKKMGADPFRLWGVSNVPWDEVRFNEKDVTDAANDLNIILNIGSFLRRFTPNKYVDPLSVDQNLLRIEDRWLISRWNSVLKEITENMDKYEFHLATRKIRSFLINDVSRLYLKILKPRIKNEGEDRDIGLSTLRYIFFQSLKVLSLMAPHTAEYIYIHTYKDALDGEGYNEVSINMYDWPTFDLMRVDRLLEKGMVITTDIVSTVANLRQRVGIKLRWPIDEVVVVSDSTEVENTIDKLYEVIKLLANTEGVKFTRDFLSDYTVEVDEEELVHEFGEQAEHVIGLLRKMNPADVQKQLELRGYVEVDGFQVKKGIRVREDAGEFIGSWTQYGKVYIRKELSPELKKKGLLREVIRRIQDLRKREGMIESDRINVDIYTEGTIRDAVEEFMKELKDSVGAVEVHFVGEDDIPTTDKPKNTWKVEGEPLKIRITKVG